MGTFPKKRKWLPIHQVKSINDTENGGIVGYASQFNHIDSYQDRVIPGAYRDTIPDFIKKGFIAWEHLWEEPPIATVTTAREDSLGLWIETEYHSDPRSQQMRSITNERIARGKDVGLSIGYIAEEFRFVDEDGNPLDDDEFSPSLIFFGLLPKGVVRELLKIRLFETSHVMVPADAYAGIEGAKSQWLDSADKYAVDGDRVLDAVSTFVARSQDLLSLRVKEGRVLSDANRQRLIRLKDSLSTGIEDLDKLLKDTEPVKLADPDEVRHLQLEFERLRSRALGVGV